MANMATARSTSPPSVSRCAKMSGASTTTFFNHWTGRAVASNAASRRVIRPRPRRRLRESCAAGRRQVVGGNAAGTLQLHGSRSRKSDEMRDSWVGTGLA